VAIVGKKAQAAYSASQGKASQATGAPKFSASSSKGSQGVTPAAAPVVIIPPTATNTAPQISGGTKEAPFVSLGKSILGNTGTSQAVQGVSVDLTAQPKTSALKTTTYAPYTAPPFTQQGFKEGMQRVAAVLNPFDWGKITFTPTNTDVTYITKGLVVGAEAAGIYGIGAAAAGALGGSGVVGGTTAAATGGALGIGSATLKTAAIAGAVGVGLGYFLGDKGITQTPTQNTPTTVTPTQTSTQTTTYGPVTTTNTQITRNTITGSPYSSIGGSPSLSNPVSQNPTQTPTQTTPVTVTPSQTTTAEGTNWGLIALVIGGAYVLSRG
jgi:hypothetical protein